MWFSRLVLSGFLLQSTLAKCASPESPATTPNAPALLEKRVNCQGGGNIVVYEFNNGMGGRAMLCLNAFVVAGCTILMAGGIEVIQALKAKATSWVTGKIGDASDAGPQANGGPESMTWGELYAFHVSNGTHQFDAGKDLTSKAALLPGEPLHADPVTTLELHEDGFSASANLPVGGVHTRNSCSEQIHIHYWAAGGHDSTLLSSNEIGDLIQHALQRSYASDYSQACYEMTNNGNWDGYLRVCYNVNRPQFGCYTCGGHNN